MELIMEKKRQRKNAAFPTIYEWDIHRGDVAKKFILKQKVEPVVEKINYVGSAVQGRTSKYTGTVSSINNRESMCDLQSPY
jgi:transcription termination factor NusB